MVLIDFIFIYLFSTVLLNKIIFFPGEAFYHLDAPVIRITGVDTPMPYVKSLEIAALPQIKDIVNAVNKLLRVTQ